MIGPIEFVVAGFNEQDKAGEVLEILKGLEKEEVIFLINAAVMVKDESGKVSIKETQDVRPGKGALFGAIAGGLIGLLGGPAGVVVGAAAGATAGGLAAKKIDMGFPDETLDELKDTLKPGSSAILALLQHEWVDRLVEEMEKHNAALFRQTLKEELAAQLDEQEAEGKATEEETKPQE